MVSRRSMIEFWDRIDRPTTRWRRDQFMAKTGAALDDRCQHGRLVDEWIAAIGLSPKAYGTHSLRRTKAALIYRKIGDIRAVQLPFVLTKLVSTVRYLGVEVEHALAIVVAAPVFSDAS